MGFLKSNSILLLIGITFLVSCSSADQKRDLYNYTLSADELELLKEGDILLRHGYGFISNTIVKTLKEQIPVSHVGILTIDPADGKHKVIHSVSQSISDADGVQKQDLKSFVMDSQPNTLIVVRYRNANLHENKTSLISERAFYYLSQKIPFDYTFDFNNTGSFFCTEFVGRVIGDVFGDEIFSDDFLNSLSDLEKLKFNVFFDPDRFDVILNHHLRR
jgi:hypothetical protein